MIQENEFSIAATLCTEPIRPPHCAKHKQIWAAQAPAKTVYKIASNRAPLYRTGSGHGLPSSVNQTTGRVNERFSNRG